MILNSLYVASSLNHHQSITANVCVCDFWLIHKTISFNRSQVSRLSFSPQSTPIAKPCVGVCVQSKKRKKKKGKVLQYVSFLAALFEFISATICDVMALRPEFDPFFQHLKFDNVQRANSQTLPKTKKKKKREKEEEKNESWRGKRQSTSPTKCQHHHQERERVLVLLYIWHPQFFFENNYSLSTLLPSHHHHF